MDDSIITRINYSIVSFDILRSIYEYVRLWGERFRRLSNNSKQQQSQPNIFPVVVVVVAFGRWPSFPTAW